MQELEKHDELDVRMDGEYDKNIYSLGLDIQIKADILKEAKERYLKRGLCQEEIEEILSKRQQAVLDLEKQLKDEEEMKERLKQCKQQFTSESKQLLRQYDREMKECIECVLKGLGLSADDVATLQMDLLRGGAAGDEEEEDQEKPDKLELVNIALSDQEYIEKWKGLGLSVDVATLLSKHFKGKGDEIGQEEQEVKLKLYEIGGRGSGDPDSLKSELREEEKKEVIEEVIEERKFREEVNRIAYEAALSTSTEEN
ncbi:MAG: hypothetical protein LBU29_04655, partial [Endomicrobium sp.]|nr:hypothetical protein [Endomicrobium sp.]